LHICFADISQNKIPNVIQRDSDEMKILLNHIKYGNSTKAKFINEDKKDGFYFMEKGFTSTNVKQCEDDQVYFHLDG